MTLRQVRIKILADEIGLAPDESDRACLSSLSIDI